MSGTTSTLNANAALLALAIAAVAPATCHAGAPAPEHQQRATTSPAPAVKWGFSAQRLIDLPKEWTEIACGADHFYYLADSTEPCPSSAPNFCHLESLALYSEASSGSPCEPQPERHESPGSGPWVAVVDWDNSHGCTMLATVSELTNHGLDPRLYRLDPQLLPIDLGGTTDAHVLRALCSLLDDVETRGLPAPQAVSMSFGRLAQQGEHRPCDLGESLSCEIWHSLDRLNAKRAGSLGNQTASLAAAGNFGDTDMVPAAYTNVLSVGALDVTRYSEDGAITASWESNRAVNALFPGSGVCLPELGTTAPAGTSTSAAGFAAVFARLLQYYPIESWQYGLGLWYADLGPLETPGPSPDVLVHRIEEKGAATYPTHNIALDELLQRLRGAGPELACWDTVPVHTVHEYASMTELESNPLPKLSFPEVIQGEHIPSPEPVICGACPAAVGFPPKLRATVLPEKGGGGQTLVVNLEGAQQLDERLHLAKFFLRIGSRFYAPGEGELDLEAIATGTLDLLALTGIERTDESVSMLFVLTLQETGCTESMALDALDETTCAPRFWTATPVLLLAQEDQPE